MDQLPASESQNYQPVRLEPKCFTVRVQTHFDISWSEAAQVRPSQSNHKETTTTKRDQLQNRRPVRIWTLVYKVQICYLRFHLLHSPAETGSGWFLSFQPLNAEEDLGCFACATMDHLVKSINIEISLCTALYKCVRPPSSVDDLLLQFDSIGDYTIHVFFIFNAEIYLLSMNL